LTLKRDAKLTSGVFITFLKKEDKIENAKMYPMIKINTGL
jgi:hypothetical protein